jgi:hypothetical protein
MLDCSKLPNHLKSICDGTHRKGDGSFHSLDDRRNILSRYLKLDISHIDIEEKSTAQIKVFNSQIGTRLHAIIEREAGCKIECSECRDEVTKLNLMTPQQVLSGVDGIASGIVARAKKKAPKFWQRWGAALAPEIAKARAIDWIEEACSLPNELPDPPIKFVTSIAVGMRVANRATPRWRQTIDSIQKSGFSKPIIFAEPDAGISEYADYVWDKKLGAFRSFTEMCKIMVNREEEWLLLCEDDVDFSDHLNSYIRTLTIGNEVISLYTSGPQQRPVLGLSECGESFTGSHAILIRRSVLKELMLSRVWLKWPKHDCVDKLIRQTTKDVGIKLLSHNPSLCQHTGDTASIYPQRQLTSVRLAKDWTQEGPWTPPLVTLITPTGDRPDAFAMCERWIQQQDYTGPIQWIVIDDGHTATNTTQGQFYLREKPQKKHSLCRNIRSAIPHIKGECILIIEDDDYYHPHYISTMVGRLHKSDLVGEVGAKYYYVRESKYYHFTEHKHSSLCRTGMKANVIDTLKKCAEGNNASIDLRLWAQWKGSRETWKDLNQNQPLCVGIKGVEGRPSKNWKLSRRSMRDSDHRILKKWIGSDWKHYVKKPENITIQSNDVTVYTCIYNSYDPIKNPITPGKSKFVCATDQIVNDATLIWEQRLRETPNDLSNGKRARYYKINSHLMDFNTEWSFYIDGSMRLIVDPEEVIDDCLRLGDANLYLWHHHERNCIYDEAIAVGNSTKETKANADAMYMRYRELGFPEKSGLYLGGIIVRRGSCQKFNETWWREVESGSVRDQISLPVAIVSSGIKMLAHPPMTWTKYMVRHAHRSKKKMQRDILNAAKFGVKR